MGKTIFGKSRKVFLAASYMLCSILMQPAIVLAEQSVGDGSNCNSQTSGNNNTINMTCIVIERKETEKEIIEVTDTQLGQPVTNLLDQIQNSIANQQTGGIYGVVKVDWLDHPQTGFVMMNGSYGILRSTYQFPNGAIETIDQDLSLSVSPNGSFLIGSNARIAGTNIIHQAYAPDTFRLQYNYQTGLYYIDSVCDSTNFCSRINTQPIFY